MPVVQPNEMDFTSKKFSMIISGSPGIGKTTLALSAPRPVLIDLDKGISRVQARHRKTAVICDTYEQLKNDLETPEVKAAETIIIDTGGSLITYMQDWAMRDNPGLNKQRNGSISLKGFGAVKGEFSKFTNHLQCIANKNIIYVFHTVEEKDKDNTKQRLMCEGAARNIVWQPCDLGCHMQMIGDDRVLGFTPTEEYFAKGCYGITGLIKVPTLTPTSYNNFLTLLFDQAHANIEAEKELYAEENALYESAMETGRGLIIGITDAVTAQASGEAMKGIVHALTSEKELRIAFTEQLAKTGLKYDKGVKGYVKA